MEYLYIVIIGLLVIFLVFINSPKGKGVIGEWKVNRVLKRAALEYGGIEITDLMLEDNRSSSQIDNLLLTTKALYVFEVKNYTGHIFGSEDQMNWTVTVKHVNKKRSKSGRVYKKTHISKHKFYNPIKQNHTHINKIKNLTNISDVIPVFNIVVFGTNAVIRDVKHSPATYVLHHTEIMRFIHQKEQEIEHTIDDEQLIDIIDLLYSLNIVDKRRRKQHVNDIKSKHKK
jgi:hypothetical protein